MTMFVTPDAKKSRGLSSAPTAQTYKVGGLIDEIPDIPYIQGEYVIGGTLRKACCTFWEPDTEDRLLIAAGASVQILTLADRPAVQTLSAALIDSDVPPTPVVTGMARYMYERVHRTSWDAATPEAKENWEKLASGAYDVFAHWHKGKSR